MKNESHNRGTTHPDDRLDADWPISEDITPHEQDYSPRELQRNRFWNRMVTACVVAGIWAAYSTGALTGGAATALNVLVVISSSIYRALFASPSAVKLDENSAGSGKRVAPRTMGTILGYLYDGFK